MTVPGPLGPGEDECVSASASAFLSLLRRAVPPAEAAPPGRVGRFEVLGPLGRGGFGTVLLARDPDLDRLRALKLPGPAALACPDALARFLREGRRAARVDHPNVARVYEAGHDGRTAYLAMEFCPGGSLADWLAARPPGRPLPPGWAAELVARVADGVAAAHAAGILHRDLKPGNVLLAPDPDATGPDADATGPGPGPDPPAFRPKVGDFGLAKLLGPGHAGDDPTAAGVALGTLPYMSPEAARGDALGPAADVYALGVILFQLLTRRRPFEAPSDAALLGRITSPEPAPRARALRPGLPRDLDAACAAALAKDPADRYPSPAAFADDLRRCLRGEPVRGAPWWRRARAALRRRRARLALIALALALGIALASTFEVRRQEAASVWLQQVRAGNVDGLPGLVARGIPNLAPIRDALRADLRGSDPQKTLGAAVALAAEDASAAEFAYDRLLDGPPEHIAPLARSLNGRMTGFVARLIRDARATPPADASADPDAPARRRARAAAALVRIGLEAEGLALLRFDPDAPDARSWLIHTLGPAGVPATVLFANLTDPKAEVSIRRALILALGEVPDSAWTDDQRGKVAAELVRLYRDDPDSGVHGAAKWLLLRWGRPLEGIDGELSRIDGYRPGFRWRVGRAGLTMVKVDDPGLDRTIEVSDTEVTVEQGLRLVGGPPPPPAVCPEPGCPMTGLTYRRAAALGLGLDRAEGIAESEACYRPLGGPRPESELESAPAQRDRTGHRMPTSRESEAACRVGTRTRFPWGESVALASRYAWFNPEARTRTHRVAELKPNDLGLFDTLGNAGELCRAADETLAGANEAVLRGGSFLYTGSTLAAAMCSEPFLVDLPGPITYHHGVRVARTLGPGPAPR